MAKKPRLDSILRSDLEEHSEDVFLEAIPRGERDILVDILLPGNPVDLAATVTFLEVTFMDLSPL